MNGIHDIARNKQSQDVLIFYAKQNKNMIASQLKESKR
jgi:hypothetical protein